MCDCSKLQPGLWLCCMQACAFRDSYEKFKKAGAEVIGISGDDAASHKVLNLLAI